MCDDTINQTQGPTAFQTMFFSFRGLLIPVIVVVLADGMEGVGQNTNSNQATAIAICSDGVG